MGLERVGAPSESTVVRIRRPYLPQRLILEQQLDPIKQSRVAIIEFIPHLARELLQIGTLFFTSMKIVDASNVYIECRRVEGFMKQAFG